MVESTRFDVAVAGAGPSGLTAAIMLAASGFRTALIAPDAPDDRRTTALLGGSVALLDRMGILDEVASAGASMHTMRLIDDTGRLVRAPEVNFRCQEIGRDVFGYNIHNSDLNAILARRAASLDALTRIPARVASTTLGEDHINLALETGETVTARLAVAADGARSVLREMAGIEVRTWSYPQTAIVFDVTHQLPHGGVSVEFHTRSGPFVLVPLPGRQSSIVLVETPEVAAGLIEMDAAALAAEIERRSHSIFGKIEIASPRQSFPLSGATAKAFAANRVMLVGEAGHRFPPIGAQGLNLSFRDVGSLVEGLVESRRMRRDIGGGQAITAYDRRRRADVTTRTMGVDIMDRALLSEHLPVQVARSLGLFLAGSVPPLRRLMMREGLTPTIGTPRLMRPTEGDRRASDRTGG